MKIENNLSHLREQRGMTQKEVAEELGITRQAISQWESGRAFPSMEKQIALSRLYGITVEALYCQGDKEEAKENVPQKAASGLGEEPLSKCRRNQRGKIVACIILAAYICFAAGMLWWGYLENSNALAICYLILGTAALMAGGFIFFAYTIFKYIMRRHEK